MRPIVSLGLSVLLLGCTTTAPSVEPTPQSTPMASNEVAFPMQGQQLPITAQANINGEVIQLEVAQTPQQQATGLMYRTELADNQGMLFSFASPRRVGFWMKNVKIPLDMVFLREGQVRAIAANVPPCTADPCPVYGPEEPVDQVIELRGERANELGLQVGDLVSIQPLNPE